MSCEKCSHISVSNYKQVKSTFFYLNWEKNDFYFMIFDGNALYLRCTLCCHTETLFQKHKYGPVHLKTQGSILRILFFKQLFV